MLKWQARCREYDDEARELDDPLLSENDGTHQCDRYDSRTWTSYLWSGRYLHGTLILLYTSLFFILMYTIPNPKSNACLVESSKYQPRKKTIPHRRSMTLHLRKLDWLRLQTQVPNREGLRWEYRKFPTNLVNNPFTGNPREELDEAWHELLQSRFPLS